MGVREEEIEKQNKEEQDTKGNVNRTTYRDWIEDATSGKGLVPKATPQRKRNSQDSRHISISIHTLSATIYVPTRLYLHLTA